MSPMPPRTTNAFGDGASYADRGACGELLVAALLLRHGFEVFRSLSQNCKCDLIVRDQAGQLYEVECRTGQRSSAGNVHFPRKPGDVCTHYALIVYPDTLAEEPFIEFHAVTGWTPASPPDAILELNPTKP